MSTQQAPVTIYLVRHGKTMLNTTERTQGWIDSPLTQEGIQIAENLGHGFRKNDLHFDAAFSSDQVRAVKTARIVLDANEQTDVPIKQLAGLREECFGVFEGEKADRVAQVLFPQYKTFAEAMTTGKLGVRELADAIAAYTNAKTPEEGESYQMLSDRLDAAMKQVGMMAQAQGAQNVLVVSHGNSIFAWLANQGLSYEEIGFLYNASVSLIAYKDGAFKVEAVNQMNYVNEGADDAAGLN
ncbi:hypothetical protein IV38_GL001814 [Lactobacillus selangorensis]|uniref:phosphoglycerate mutase (2,3-diphosphoglycerate-dependent) n=1 Tax=Lactobacillus selangorensis TaxID=81857 RepID=A0A0R2FNN9_9LACO|nr:histidine phosphatase family protein [Lactobacillus selangorensis]KRN27973.1 hypothetical protein IV38_GL001814 [Lactobacillus selangorensis]KRN30556.1 hypothetical protein IV40_GL001742 [Lactobacillus selangorensis]